MRYCVETWEKFADSASFPKVPCKIGTNFISKDFDKAMKVLKSLQEKQRGLCCMKTKENDCSFFFEDNPKMYHFWFEINERDEKTLGRIFNNK